MDNQTRHARKQRLQVEINDAIESVEEALSNLEGANLYSNEEQEKLLDGFHEQLTTLKNELSDFKTRIQ